MLYSNSLTSQKRLSRQGLSFVEFVGCLAALGGGMVIGSMYLGLDVKAMAVGVLEKADISVPEVLKEAALPTSDEAAPSDSTSEEPSAVSESEGSEINIDSPTSDTGDPTAESGETSANESGSNAQKTTEGLASAESKPLTKAEVQVATETYWKTFNECIHKEYDNRSKSISDPGSWQLFDYLLHRKDGHQNVVDTVEQLDKQGVDQRLTTHAQHMLTWHRAGAELYDRATHLLTDAPAGKLSGPFAQSWQSSATQHRMEEKLLLNKHNAVASYLEHTYRISPAPESK